MTQIAAIAHHERGPLRASAARDTVGSAAPDHEADAALGERSPDVLETLQHEAVVAQIGVRVVVHQAERDQHRQPIAVGHLDGVFQGRVERGALRLLHPVEHVAPAALVAVVEPPASRGLDHRPSPYLELAPSLCEKMRRHRAWTSRARSLLGSYSPAKPQDSPREYGTIQAMRAVARSDPG